MYLNEDIVNCNRIIFTEVVTYGATETVQSIINLGYGKLESIWSAITEVPSSIIILSTWARAYRQSKLGTAAP
jgi:hypothetical protein